MNEGKGSGNKTASDRGQGSTTWEEPFMDMSLNGNRERSCSGDQEDAFTKTTSRITGEWGELKSRASPLLRVEAKGGIKK